MKRYCSDRYPTYSYALSGTREARSRPILTIRQIVLGLVLAEGVLGQVLGDRAPSLEERFRIETTLRNEGFTRWAKSNSTTRITSGRSTAPIPLTAASMI